MITTCWSHDTHMISSSTTGSQLPQEHTTAISLEKNITLMMKTVKVREAQFFRTSISYPQIQEVQSHHPIGFVSFLTPTLQLIYTTIIEPRDEGTWVRIISLPTLVCVRLRYVCIVVSEVKYSRSLSLCVIFSGQLYERYIIQALNLLKQIIKCEDYNLTNLQLSECTLLRNITHFVERPQT